MHSCVHAATVGHNVFGHRITKGQLSAKELADITGIAASRVLSGIVYVHNYEGDGNFLYAVDVNSAQLVATFTITGAQNFDWEDIGYGPCADDCKQTMCSGAVTPQRFCLYIADIGSHGGTGAADVIYMVREPTVLINSSLPVVDKLTFSWSEPDAESLMVAPDGRLFIISKVNTGRAMIAQLPSDAWGTTVNLDLGETGILKVITTHHDPQGADISPDGTELVIVAEEEVFYYRVPNGDYINAVRTSIPESIHSYSSEPNTEGIAWAPDGKGFYVIPRGEDQMIYYYPKDDAGATGPGVGRR
ncbi:PE-PGRS family protein [Plakobranchus ocellatus]|uniref:PE-PGRS family protein n=1 Tax=Plakobranchus ocellatus TaxID=259542 RepID=A0AAV4ASW3_9GAST|nr:PE-PGRS family protein [Plakobranchus ocellatus]